MSNTTNEFTTMIVYFRCKELQSLLKTFQQCTKGSKLQLKKRVHQLLMGEPRLEDYQGYLEKILEIYDSMPNNLKHPQQSTFNSWSEMLHYRTTLLTFREIKNAGVKNFIVNSPFFTVCAEIIKPIILVGHAMRPKQNSSEGMMEAKYKFILSPVILCNLLAMKGNISEDKNKDVYQLQIRIYNFDSIVLDDCFPRGFHNQVSKNVNLLSAIAVNTQGKTMVRRLAQPINYSTQLLTMNSSTPTTITINWFPDGKTYAMGLYLVKELTSKELLQKIYDKEPKSLDDTKNSIMKYLANDQDMATISYQISLVCPVGQIRMNQPGKSTKCDHLQCFDVRNFILMNEKNPTWICPICNQPCLYDDIQIDAYFLKIVTSPNLPDDCKEIELLADGTWKVYEKKSMDFMNVVDGDDENS